MLIAVALRSYPSYEWIAISDGRPFRRAECAARSGFFHQEVAMLFPTTLVGSYPQPEWLIDRQKLHGRFPPRVRAKELWRVPAQWLAEAQEDATIMAIKA